MIDAKRKAMIFLTIAFILAVVTAGLVLNEIRQMQMALGERIYVAIARDDIPSYTEVTSDMVEWVQIPNTDKFSSYITAPQELDNSVLIVKVGKGELITKSIVRSKMDIPVDHRVVWLNVTKNVVIDQEIAENDLVDIVVFYQDLGTKTVLSKRLFANVPIVQRQDGENGIALKASMSLQDAENYIYLQNTASQIRILRVNQIQRSEHLNQTPTQEMEQHEEDQTQEPEQPRPQQPQQAPPQQEQKTTPQNQANTATQNAGNGQQPPVSKQP
ncbi:SAF domain-containing protein [Brevibacillus migulae]|uniref:SAF domain-containing protein n=1 Tax=Brevibacillus migulae TaxID=1644114 RepID=UPI00106EBBD6|nr:SAF domain-containing protein [Brevibacillus migulae]